MSGNQRLEGVVSILRICGHGPQHAMSTVAAAHLHWYACNARGGRSKQQSVETLGPHVRTYVSLTPFPLTQLADVRAVPDRCARGSCVRLWHVSHTYWTPLPHGPHVQAPQASA